MTETHLDRLNYYNGKRLVASDFKLEQEYHIRVRRWLNKSLYSAGIAEGLEVREDKGRPAVIVSPGLALDADGREIILLEEVRLDVLGSASASPCGGPPGEGSYLTIQYREAVVAEERDGCCAPATPASPSGNRVAWGGPARVRAEPMLRWTDVFPSEGSGEIVLAQVSLKTGCAEVQSIDAGVRRYIGAGSAARVRQFALEGVRDVHAHPVDVDAHQRIYFHIRGRQATSVTLYLRGEKMPALYYTEMGAHNHTLSVQATPDGMHRHTIGEHQTNDAGSHQHKVADDFLLLPDPGVVFKDIFGVFAGLAGFTKSFRWRLMVARVDHYRKVNADGSVAEQDFPPLTPNDNSIGPISVNSAGSHRHNYGLGQQTIANDPLSAHTHAMSSTATPAGVTDPTATRSYTAHGGAPLTYVADLEIWIDGVDHTASIKSQLQSSIPTERNAWTRIGDGNKTHPLVTNGTRAIKLDFLPGLFFAEGEHWIELRVPQTLNSAGAPVPNGGRINYNLYVE